MAATWVCPDCGEDNYSEYGPVVCGECGGEFEVSPVCDESDEMLDYSPEPFYPFVYTGPPEILE